MAKGQLIVISGPSGVGKSTLIRSLTAKLQQQPFFSVSATTRKMRPGEIDHVNYHFITQAEFDRMVAQNEFLEHATYAAHSYGTPAAPILAQLEAGRLDRDPLRGDLLDKLMAKLRRVSEGLERSRQEGTAARRAELRALLDELNEMKKEWEAWQR